MKKISIILCLFFIVFSDFVYCQNEIKILDKRKFFFLPIKNVENAKNGYNKYIKVKICHLNNDEFTDTNKYKIVILDINNKKIVYAMWENITFREFPSIIITKKIYMATKKNYKILYIPYYLYHKNKKTPILRLCFNSYKLSLNKYKLYVTYKDEYKTYYSDTIPLYVW